MDQVIQPPQRPGEILTIGGNQTKNICQMCGQSHAPHTKCHYDAHYRRVVKLLEANSIIPSLLAANKEATEIARTFQKMAKDSAMAIATCEEVVKSYENGEEIWATFQERLEKQWPAETTSQGTEGPRDQAAQSTLSETSDKPCIEGMTPGETTLRDSLQSTASATPVGKGQQSPTI